MQIIENSHTYALHENTYFLEGAGHIGYGITVRNSHHRDPLFCIEDITTEKETLLALIRLCNAEALDPLHLRDVVEDFLTSR